MHRLREKKQLWAARIDRNVGGTKSVSCIALKLNVYMRSMIFQGLFRTLLAGTFPDPPEGSCEPIFVKVRRIRFRACVDPAR